jgi:hypothetical protein
LFSVISFAQSSYNPQIDELEVSYSKGVPVIEGELIVSYPDIRPQYPGGEKVLQEHIQNELEYDNDIFWEDITEDVVKNYLDYMITPIA